MFVVSSSDYRDDLLRMPSMPSEKSGGQRQSARKYHFNLELFYILT
jgi:hypothetical protein